MKKHRMITSFLTLVLIFAMLPTAALAADTPPSSYTQDGITATITHIPFYEAYQRSSDGNPARYDMVRFAGERMFLYREKDSKQFGLLDINGNEVGKIDLSISYAGDIYYFHDGLCRVRYFDTSVLAQRWGFVDKTGKLVIGGLHDAGDFYDGRAVIRNESGNYNVIDKSGAILYSMYRSDEIYHYSEGLALTPMPSTIAPDVHPTLNRAFCDIRGNEVMTVPREMRKTYEFSDAQEPRDTYDVVSKYVHYGMAVVRSRKDEGYYLMDQNSGLTPLPENMWVTENSVIPLGGNTFFYDSNSGMRGIMDTNGNIIYPFTNDLKEGFQNGAFRIRTSGKEGLITRKGNVLIPAEWEDIDVSDFWEAANQGAAVGKWKSNGYPNTAIYLIEVTEGGSTPPSQPQQPQQPQQPEKLAYASTQTVTVDGKAVEFQMYALKDANGNDTNYIKLRDVAATLNGTAAQFEVSWDGTVNIVTGQPYTANGSEMSTPFSGNRAYTVPTSETKVNGSAANLEAIVLTDDSGDGYTYYKLRDLGAALGFTVDWSAEQGVFIQTARS